MTRQIVILVGVLAAFSIVSPMDAYPADGDRRR